ncbi:endogenous retrovirus group S71 member 1 Env polyprotein-like isoform X1 [Felis catus]|uniref:endogenous retrovirus group S71 member 1 Env polyprotein-like isoform X1 n=1 Tax=Felis catus TaxID=9685 RepID=UPI001D1A31FF|nr:endogenous retrovirus group S71 member 1 Env polyprotein-like isoform X1 [Felis catus]XP_044895905.1 endogenous retrovirus group S71 member 1 Env polyprotein-like isoform X1 [Felis catus]
MDVDTGIKNKNWLTYQGKKGSTSPHSTPSGTGNCGIHSYWNCWTHCGGPKFQNCKQVDRDLGYLETSISRLEHQVDPLAEVVLQNRRGLDLLFMKEGGLCMALGETCCFYANNSGVIRNTLSLVRDNLRTRERAREASNNWYQSFFSWSPWLTSLLTAVAGPLLLLLLGLTIGPCLINWLVQYVKKRVSEIKIMMIWSNYIPLVPNDESRD